MNMLVDYQLEHYGENSKSKFEKYINPLKQLIGNDDLLNFCKELLIHVEKGKKDQILALFEIFGYDLDLLPVEEQELVQQTYIYNIAGGTAWGNEVATYKFRELFTFLGLY